MKTTGIHERLGQGAESAFSLKQEILHRISAVFFSSCDITPDSLGRASLPPQTSLRSETSPSSQQKSNYSRISWHNSQERRSCGGRGWVGCGLTWVRL